MLFYLKDNWVMLSYNFLSFEIFIEKNPIFLKAYFAKALYLNFFLL
jgi:hypothetical protein